MHDIVIISVPGTVSRLAPAAPALLRASVEQAGFSCRTCDFNIRLYHDVDQSDAVETYFSTGLNPEQEPLARALVQQWTQEVVALDPQWVGISVFTYQNRTATRLFCEELRRTSNIKIVLGGQGITDGGLQGSSTFAEQMLKQGLADCYIRSEGEISLVELLRGNLDYPGINSETFQQIDDLDALPFPNYDDYVMSQYHTPALPVIGSRGCVRACSFCDIHEHWKYRYRTGENVFQELLYLNQHYEIKDFWFGDSLINGNLREFGKFIELLAQHNRGLPLDQRISWTSQFIVRPVRLLPQQFWKNLADSGAVGLSIGVETGSDAVRTHMRKGFSNQDLDDTMSLMHQHGITCVFLMIVGYPTETEEDFQATLDMFTRYQHLANCTIKNVNIGSTLGILPGTELHKQAQHLNIELDQHENNWVAYDNPDLTLERRLSRRKQLQMHLQNLGYVLKQDSTEHMLQILESKKHLLSQRLELKRMIRIKQQNQVQS